MQVANSGVGNCQNQTWNVFVLVTENVNQLHWIQPESSHEFQWKQDFTLGLNKWSCGFLFPNSSLSWSRWAETHSTLRTENENMTWQSLESSHNLVFYERPHVIATQTRAASVGDFGATFQQDRRNKYQNKRAKALNSLPGRVNIDWLTGKSQLILLFGEGSSGTEEEPHKLASTLGLQNTSRKFLSKYFCKVVLNNWFAQ